MVFNTLIMALAVSVTLFLTVMPGTRAEAASPVAAASQKMLEKEEREEEARKLRSAELSPKAKEAGFIAISESRMDWADAKAFCQQHGGRLPRINNSDSWDRKNPPLRGVLIDGFGYGLRPWGEVGLPSDVYWTDTAYSGSQGLAWVVNAAGGGVSANGTDVQRFGSRVVCVP